MQRGTELQVPPRGQVGNGHRKVAESGPPRGLPRRLDRGWEVKAWSQLGRTLTLMWKMFSGSNFAFKSRSRP
jgi:hypothetical protein